MASSLKDLQNQLREFPCHFLWNLEHKSIKQFRSLIDSITKYNADSPAMVIEGLLFKTYLFFSDFKGNVEKKKMEAIECLNEVRRLLVQDTRQESLKNGYLSIAIALEAWLDRRDKTKLEAKIRELRELGSKYEVNSPDYNMFQGSVHATKGFSFSRLGMIRYAEGIEELKKAVHMCPEETDWLFLLGLIIWRIAKASVRRNEFCGDRMSQAETILYSVMELDSQHSYAMVLIAEIKRRKKKFDDAEDLLTSVLSLSKQTRTKVFGEAAQVYRRMKKYPEALSILHKLMAKPSSFIYHQLYLVYRNMKTLPPVDYLQMAIEANPSNMAAQCDRAKEFMSKKEYTKAQDYYDSILDNNANDPEAIIETTYHYAMFLEKIEKREDSVDKFQALVDHALEECKDNDAPPFTFFVEINWMVDMSVKRIRRYFERCKANMNDRKEPLLKLAELEKKLGNYPAACDYSHQLLGLLPPVNVERRWGILEDLATMQVSLGPPLQDEVDSIIEDMEQLSSTHPKPEIMNKCKADLAVEKGKRMLAADADGALKYFLEAVTFGSLTGARLLLGKLKSMDTGKTEFYIYCAQIGVCIERSQGDDAQQLKEDLKELLSADISDVGVVLGDLRNTQFNMERSIILQDNTQLVAFRVDVIHKCRTILNQTMSKFRERRYKGVETCCDYFNIPKCSAKNVVKQVRNKLQKKYEWVQVDLRFPDFFKFIVSIQPASNPQEKNWMFALFRMDNANKHEFLLGDKLKVEVYSDKLGNMVEQEFTTLEVARKACDNIQNILEEFYKYL